MNIYLGFDPGGKNSFGWSVCFGQSQPLRIIDTGVSGNAEEAMEAALGRIPLEGVVVGVGIDAPLFWTKTGESLVDNQVRKAITELGALSPGGTIQQINSLRGACLVQGVLLAHFLYEHFPKASITESHPKALLCLLGIANKGKQSVKVVDLSKYVEFNKKDPQEHERDAVLGAFTAFAQRQKLKGWVNLFERETEPVIPFNYQVGYWMPWGLVRKT